MSVLGIQSWAPHSWFKPTEAENVCTPVLLWWDCWEWVSQAWTLRDSWAVQRSSRPALTPSVLVRCSLWSTCQGGLPGPSRLSAQLAGEPEGTSPFHHAARPGVSGSRPALFCGQAPSPALHLSSLLPHRGSLPLPHIGPVGPSLAHCSSSPLPVTVLKELDSPARSTAGPARSVSCGQQPSCEALAGPSHLVFAAP